MALRLLLGAVFVAAGIMKLLAIEFEVRSFAHFGYAPWFMYAIGGLELAAGLALLSARAAPFGAALLLPVMVGAAASHLRAGDGFAMAAVPAVFLLLLAVVVCVRRGSMAWPSPADQRFAG